MATGKVKWFDTDKDYGFIRPDEGGGDVFVPPGVVTVFERPLLHEGLRVRFDPVRTPNGNVSAIQVHLAPADDPANNDLPANIGPGEQAGNG